MKINANKIVVILLIAIVVSMLAGCAYFYPNPDLIYEPELIQQKDIDLDFKTIQKGDIFKGYVLGLDDQSHCKYVNDPKKTIIANAGIEKANIKKIYVQEGDYVMEGDVLIEYEYIVDEDKEFTLSISNRRAALKYENAKIQYSQGNMSQSAMESFEKSYLSAQDKLDEFHVEKEKYTLKANYEGYIAKIEGYSISTDIRQDVSFHICDIEDGLILVYADKSNEIAAFPFYAFREGSNARIYNEELGVNEKATLKMNNTTFSNQYDEYLEYFYGKFMVYIVLEFSNDKLPKDIRFKQSFNVSLIQKEIYDVILVPRNAVVSTAWNEHYVHKMSAEGILETTYIRIGEKDENYYEVLEGLQVGDKVLVR